MYPRLRLLVAFSCKMFLVTFLTSARSCCFLLVSRRELWSSCDCCRWDRKEDWIQVKEALTVCTCLEVGL
ncbi:unnamed protein product [Moneuplotes crassus]|uniref:Uncharacterized protein n=1 Tax=Euplotes crassus TaxID=5936 RepID=A0AAD1Y282_EUPCR|nr:unnamed protein product [Moneuplotes crassus]